MKTKTLYKHKNNTDVAMLIFDYKLNEKNLMKCAWFNIVNPNNIYFISYDNIKINENDLNNWEEYINKEI